MFGTGDIDIVHNTLGLLNATGDIKLTRWTLNPKWHVHDMGLLATKTVTGTARFEAPDSGPSFRVFVSYRTDVLRGDATERCPAGRHHYCGIARDTATMPPGYIPGIWTTLKKSAIAVIRC